MYFCVNKKIEECIYNLGMKNLEVIKILIYLILILFMELSNFEFVVLCYRDVLFFK